MANNAEAVPDELLLWPASVYTGRSRETLLTACVKGRVRSRVIGGRIFLDRRDLDALKTPA